MHIPTAPSTVSKMRAEAKRRSRAGDVTHTQALEAIAVEHSYDNWHHVTLCEARTKARSSMTTITLAGIKGGSGLTTLCEELGVVASASGKSVALVDADGDGTLLHWAGHRRKFSVRKIRVESAPAEDLPTMLSKLRDDGVDYAFVDLEKTKSALRRAHEYSDFILIPVQDNPVGGVDMTVLEEDTLPNINTDRAGLVVVDGLGCVDSKYSDLEAQMCRLREFGLPVFEPLMSYTQPFDTYGLGVFEHAPDTPPFYDIERLYEDTLREIARRGPRAVSPGAALVG